MPAWTEISNEATRSLKHFLAARKLIEVTGPLGWSASTVDLGHVTAVEGPAAGVEAAQRQVLPLVELRTPFEISLAILDDAERGAADLDLDVVVDAARLAALAEDGSVFHGFASGGLDGIAQATPHDPIDIADDYDDYPQPRGPGRRCAAGRRGGRALRHRARRPVLHGCHRDDRARRLPRLRPPQDDPRGPGHVGSGGRRRGGAQPAGGDFELVIGEDFSIGYRGTEGAAAQLYLEESIAVRINSPEAAIRLVYP